MADALKKVLQRNLLASLKKGEFQEADRLLDALRDEDPISVETRGLELESLIYRKRFDDAEPLARQLVHLYPSSGRVHYLAGRLAYAQRRYADAEIFFRESERIFPNWFTHLFLGKTLTQKGDFDQAEAILGELAGDHITARRDLSWLYERQGDYHRALREIDAVLESYPDDEFARNQQRRLRSLCLDPDEVVSELDALGELGEPIDENMLPQYVDGLFRTGQAARARQVVLKESDRLPPHIAIRIAWNCYRLQAFDVSYQLFAMLLPHQSYDVKMLAALEKSARRAGRLDQVVELYRQRVGEEPRFYGRLRKLDRDA
jgi:tetratricopeptide (TPR) repeat protein